MGRKTYGELWTSFKGQPMRFVQVSIMDMTLEELWIATEIGAYDNWRHHQQRLAYLDWGKAVVRVATPENPYPKDDEIRPTAYKVYLERITTEALEDLETAVKQLQDEGDSYPSEPGIYARARQIQEEKERALSTKFWLKAEREIAQYRKGYLPIEMV